MGLIRCGPPTVIISQLKEAYRVRTFVETGTYMGETANWASQEFENVITIEHSESLYLRAVQKYASKTNIQFILGDTRDKLHEIVAKLDAASIFWLDAHWSGGETHGDMDECPLIQEIKVLNNSPHDHFIFVDDARLFESPPPHPHKIEQWPTIDNVIETLNSGKHRYYIVINEDVIVAVPLHAKQLVASHFQEINTLIWEDHIKHFGGIQPSSTKLVLEGLSLLKRGLMLALSRLKSSLGTSSIPH